MADCFPAEYQDWLFASLDLRQGDECAPEILEALYALNRQWVKDAELPEDYRESAALMRAYALFYMSQNIPKLWFILDKSPRFVESLLQKDDLYIRDFGSGPGTFSWAMLFYLAHNHLLDLRKVKGIELVDQSEEALAIAKRFGEMLLGEEAFKHIKLTFTRGNWQDHYQEGRADLSFFANVITEEQGELLDLDKLDTDHLIMMEPGTCDDFHRLLKVRDHLRDADWFLHFPCTSSHNCPMARDNWCHFSINRFVLPFIQRISNQAGKLNHRHHFSAFAFSRQHPEPLPAENRWRVLSKLRKEKRSGIRWICDGEHMLEVVLNRRSKRDSNKPFLTAEAGDAIRIKLDGSTEQFKRRARLSENDQVEND